MIVGQEVNNTKEHKKVILKVVIKEGTLPEDYDIVVDRVTRESSNKTFTLDCFLENLQEKF